MACRSLLCEGGFGEGDGTPGNYGYHHTALEAFSDAELVTPVDWYGGFPGTLCGDQTQGTVAKGEVVVKRSVERLVKHIQLVKDNDTALRLYNEYHERALHPQCRDE